MLRGLWMTLYNCRRRFPGMTAYSYGLGMVTTYQRGVLCVCPPVTATAIYTFVLRSGGVDRASNISTYDIPWALTVSAAFILCSPTT